MDEVTRSRSTDRAHRAWPVAAVLLHLAIVLPLAWLLPLWIDEVYSFETVRAGVVETWNAGLGFARQAPGYFVFLWGWQELFGPSTFAARLPSVLATLGTVALMPAVARRYLPGLPVAGPVLAFVVALNALVVAAATEVRLYGPWLLLFAILLLSFHDAFLAERRSRRAAVAYVLAAIVGVYLQYFTAVFLVGQWLALACLRRWRPLRDATVAGTVVLLAILPLAGALWRQLADIERATRLQEPGTPGRAITEIVLRATDLGAPVASLVRRIAMLYPSLRLPADAHEFAAWALLLVALPVAWRLRRRLPEVPGPPVPVLVLLAVQAAFFVGLHVGLTADYTAPRHVTGLLLPACIVTTWFVAAAWRCYRSRAFRAALLVAGVLVYGGTLWWAFAPLTKSGDFARVAAHLRQHVEPGQLVLVHPSFAKSVLDRYETGPGRLRALPRDEEFERYDVETFVVASAEQIEAVIRREGAVGRELWLVSHSNCSYHGVDFGCATVERWATGRYTTLADRRFRGTQVRRLRPRAPEHAADAAE